MRRMASEHESHTRKQLADLVLEGGGVKGIGLVGAVYTLEQQGYEFKRIAGTSAGSIVGALVAAGWSGQDLLEMMLKLDYTKFRDETFLSYFGPLGKLGSLLVNNGLYRGRYIERWIEARLAERNIRTFEDLKLSKAEAAALPANQRYKLVIVTADLSKGEMVYLPWDYHKYGLDPDKQSVASAVRASMSIPYFYTPWHVKRNTFVDGGVLSNFPVDIFDSSPEMPTFGVKLSSREKALQVPHKVSGPLSLATALFSTMMDGHDQRHLDNPCTQMRTMFVDTEDIQTTDFDITKNQQQRLFANGQKSALKFLQTWDFAEYKRKCPPGSG
jgi:NTE family protein